MPKRLDLEGKTFGRLLVIKFVGSDKKGANWLCICECGNEVVALGGTLNSGRKRSCGCLQREVGERNREISKTHGMKGTRLYRIWQAMKRRCYNENSNEYPHYGDRGISICNEWHEFEPFMDWSLANGYTDKLTIDRINVNGNYEPNNCRWATAKQQARNKTSNVVIEGKTVVEWSEILEIPASTIYDRIRRGYNVEDILRVK